ncbi:hypothetical protein TSUD_173580 [Trifolium subterraneum]|nr:hypothetical protein TSUD_173580 [Trifolium subterraneum]
MAEKDIISTLPDEILCHILSFLQTKEVDATTILSKRWKNIWRSVSNVFIDASIENENSNPAFINFVNSVLFSRAALPIKSFHLQVSYDDGFEFPIKNFTNWINYVVQRGVECLNLYVCSKSYPKLPITVLTCKTLVVLKLNNIRVEQSCFSSVLLPSLKTFHLGYVDFPKLRDFMIFLKGCPVLQDLHSFDVMFDSMESLTCNEWKDFLLSNLTRANIDCYENYFPVKAVHNVASLRFYYCQRRYYHNDLIPTFYNLTQLELLCLDYSKEFILDVLNHCPKLQKLDLTEFDPTNKEVCARKDDKTSWLFPDVVPQCLSLHLRTCNLFCFSGLHGELMLASYILKNASVLQTMKIWISGKQMPAIKRTLAAAAVPMASSMCGKIMDNRVMTLWFSEIMMWKGSVAEFGYAGGSGMSSKLIWVSKV